MNESNQNSRPLQWPGDPAALAADGVDFGALAHVLGNTCCWGGRSLRFYSVAQHAATVCTAVLGLGGMGEDDLKKLALHGLLAEAWRAWLPWVPASPVAYATAKVLQKQGRERAAVQRAVLEAAGLEPELPGSWAQSLGLTQLMAEAAVCRDLADAGVEWNRRGGGPLFPPLKQRVRPLRPEKAAERWLETFNGLRPAEGLRPALPDTRRSDK